MPVKMRPYQRLCIDSVINDWKTYTDVMITAATGSGKTFMFLSLLHETLKSGERALVIAHRKELIDQPKDRMLEYYPEWDGKIGITMGAQNEINKQITVATVQTLASDRRLRELLAQGPIDYLITDECFVAGTLVDGRPIETIKIGDEIASFDESKSKLVESEVTACFKNPAGKNLLKITHSYGYFICTPNHPVLVNNYWHSAVEIRVGDSLLLEDNEKQTGNKNIMHHLRNPAGTYWRRSISIQKVRKSILQSGTCQRIQADAVIGDDGKNKSEIRQRQNDHKQPNGEGSIKREDEVNSFENEMETNDARWQRSTATGGPIDAGNSTRLGNGISSKNRKADGPRVSIELQTGYRQSRIKNWSRSGWRLSLHSGKKTAGCEKTDSFRISRVENIEVYECTDKERFAKVCPDGFVYNLEVRNTHTYLANGVIVHNCHHFTDKNTYSGILETLRNLNPNMKHLGVTATPIRADGDGIGGVYQKESAHYGIVELIKMGYLVPVRWLAIQVGISLDGVKTQAGDFQAKSLAEVFETDNCFELVVETHKKYAAGRQAIAFTASVDGAYSLAEKFNEAGIPAGAADGTTDKKVRQGILDDFRAGKLQVICNVGLWTEGLDVPEVSCIHQVRPTKSDGLYTQIIGRSLRTFPGKVDALILDYAPLDVRNISMAGDVLGVPLRKDVYIEQTEDTELGDVIGGFTFDGETNWMKGNPAEIISRQLDYLDLTPWRWYRDGGFMSLGLGKAKDEVERSLVIAPPSDGKVKLYLVAKRPTDYNWKAYLAQTDELDTVLKWADDYADKRGDAILAIKNKRWQKSDPSDAQISFAKRLKGCWKKDANHSRGELAQRITHFLAIGAVNELERWDD